MLSPLPRTFAPPCPSFPHQADFFLFRVQLSHKPSLTTQFEILHPPLLTRICYSELLPWPQQAVDTLGKQNCPTGPFTCCTCYFGLLWHPRSVCPYVLTKKQLLPSSAIHSPRPAPTSLWPYSSHVNRGSHPCPQYPALSPSLCHRSQPRPDQVGEKHL